MTANITEEHSRPAGSMNGIPIPRRLYDLDLSRVTQISPVVVIENSPPSGDAGSSARPPACPRPGLGLAADQAHVPLCLVASVAEARPNVRRRARRGSRPDGDAGPRSPGRDAENGRAVTRKRTRLAECRLRAGTRGGPQNTPPSGASTPLVVPSASGASALRSATNRLDGLGSRSRSQRGARVNSASSRSRRPGFQTESRALCSSLVRDDCRIGG